jgi:CheY-like chemotaxis protein
VPSVLIVDDEPDVLLLFRLNLELAGWTTGLAADGEEALRRLRKERFDVVILDILMPVLDGFGVLEALKDEADAPPVVVVSAHLTESMKDRVTALGARVVLSKPVEVTALSDLLLGLLPGAGVH